VKISLDAVEALDAVVRHGSFSAAAKVMRKAQSAVSYGVKQLEESLGVALFDRSGHRAVLTDAGRMVLEEGRVILARVRRVESLAARFHEDWEARVEAVIDGIFPMQPVMAALKRMADEGVPTSIQLKVEFLGGVQDRFEKDSADLMLVKDYVRSHDLVEHALPDVEVVLVAAAEHPLVNGAGLLTLSDLQRHVELTVHDSSESRRLVDNRLFGGQRVFFLSDFFTKKQAVAMGLGFGWMPLYLVQDEMSRGLLREVPYQGGSRYAFAPMLVHPRDKPLGRAGAMLLSPFRETSGVRRATPAKGRRKKRPA
jgi:DNA-binding transcriptional LysR family regulator